MNSLDLTAVVPFKDKSKMTATCVKSLLEINPGIKEVLLVSNNSKRKEIDYLNDTFKDEKKVSVLEYNEPFNYQKINNWAVKQSTGKFILLLNNDTEFTEASKGLLEKMYKRAHEPKVGMVGCLLLYGDKKTIQHAGVYLRPGLLGDHLYVGQLYKKVLHRKDTKKYPYDISKSRPLSAVTAAVQLVEKKKYDAVNGFDERFIICGGDVDLCLRLNKAGYQTWYEGGPSYIVHKESQSRAYKPVPYIDFYYSYLSYTEGYDLKRGDPFLPLVTEHMT